MTRRKLMAWLLLLLLVAVGGTYCVLWLTAPTPGFTEQNARLLRRGMTLKQVETLLGCAGRQLDLAGFVAASSSREASVSVEAQIKDGRQIYYWSNEELLVTVGFDQDGALADASFGFFFGTRINVDESFLEWLRRMLRL